MLGVKHEKNLSFLVMSKVTSKNENLYKNKWQIEIKEGSNYK